MEYLAANEVVNYRAPFSLRTRIWDQWLSTLQFCMETENGSNYFAGALLAAIIKYLFECSAKRTVDRMFFLRAANLLSYCEQVPEEFMEQVKNLAEVLLPPMSLSEAKDSIGISFEFLREFLRYEQVGHSRESVYFAAVLLSEHQDERCSEVMATGYEQQGDIDLIEVLNRCGRVPVSRHFALLQRLRNRSYKKKVFFRADELNDGSLRPLVTGRIGIRFPLHSEEKWVPVVGCYEVTLIARRRGGTHVSVEVS